MWQPQETTTFEPRQTRTNRVDIEIGTREALLADLEAALAPEEPVRLLVIFRLGGFEEFTRLGTRSPGVLIREVMSYLPEATGPSGFYYRPRRDELCGLIEGSLRDVERALLAASTALQKRPPLRETYSRLRAAYTIRSGSAAEIATARPAGRPRPESRHVTPASCETRSGGFASTTAAIVEPAAAAATTRGRFRIGPDGDGRVSSHGSTSPVSRSTAKAPCAVEATAIIDAT